MKETNKRPEAQNLHQWDITCEIHGIIETLNHATNAISVIFIHIQQNPNCYGKVALLPHKNEVSKT
jgi:hypothetical protein